MDIYVVVCRSLHGANRLRADVFDAVPPVPLALAEVLLLLEAAARKVRLRASGLGRD